MKLKIKRYEYEITSKDIFMDNGACIQLLTQSKERSTWGHIPNPCLSKRAINEISKLERLPQKHNYGEGVKIFKLKI